MNTETGMIASEEVLIEKFGAKPEILVPILTKEDAKAQYVNGDFFPFENLPEDIQKRLIDDGKEWAQIGKNTRCPCGSGKKFKRCCMKRNSK